jgi:hypothetical protein
LGRLLGRNTRDIKYFAGIKDKRTASKLNSTGNGVSPEMMGILEKIYDFLKETNDEDRLKKQEESQFAEEKELERMRRHKELMEAITGKPYTNTYTKVKKEEEGDNTSLMDSLFGKEAFKMLSRLIRFAISPLGLTILGFTAAYELVSWLAENTPDMRIPDASGALAILESGDPKLIAKYKTSDMTGREVLEDIITKGKENAQDLLTDTEGNAADIEKLGGLEAVKKLAAMEIPDPEVFAGEDYADKLPFTKEQFIGTGQSRKSKEKKWEREYAPIYNDDGTKRTKKEIIERDKSVSAQPELTSMNRTPEQAFQALNENPASLKPEPTYASNVGQKLNVLQGENLMANIFDKTAVAEAVTTNNLIRNNVDVATRGYIPPVRNQEETFQQMILYSTRVV